MHEQMCSHDEAANHQLPISCGLLNHPNSSCRGMFKLNAKSDAGLLLYLLGHFEWDSHTVWYTCLVNSAYHPSDKLVKLSLFMHAHSSPLSLAARLHRCCTNHSHYINNSWIFSRQTSYDKQVRHTTLRYLFI